MKIAALCVPGIEVDNAESQDLLIFCTMCLNIIFWTTSDGRKSCKALTRVVGRIEESHLSARWCMLKLLRGDVPAFIVQSLLLDI